MAKQATSKFGGVRVIYLNPNTEAGRIHNQVLGFVDHTFVAAEKQVENRGANTYMVPSYKTLLISYHR